MNFRNSKRSRRRGVTVILILGLLAVTIALSYSMLRTQATSAQIQSNLNRHNDARQAAHTGLTVAIRRMHDPNWAGVDVPVFGYYQDGQRLVGYYVEHETGDASLSPSDPDYSKYPYRVTLTSTAWIQDPPGYEVACKHTATAVVELVPRALSDQPTNWASLQNHTVHQWADRDVYCQGPIRIEGPAALQGTIKFCPDYPPTCRPFHGRIDEVAVFNDSLSQSKIQQIVNAAAAGNGSLPGVYASHNPIRWWRLNESTGATTVTDSASSTTGTHQNGALAGQTGVSIGGTNKAAYFDGRDDHIHVGNFNVSGGDFTVVAWFRADSWKGSDDARIISKATGTETDEHYWMLSTTTSGSNRRLRFRLRTMGYVSTLVASSGNLQTNRWYCAAAVYDGIKMRLYLDGNEVGNTYKFGLLDTNSSAPVYIGDNPPGSSRGRYLRDLAAMNAAGAGDWRPFTGPIDLPTSNNDSDTLAMIQEDLNVSINNVTENHSAPVSHPGNPSSYQLYSGGKTYPIGWISSGYRTEDISFDMQENPLGIYRVYGELQLGPNVNVTGTIITMGSNPDIHIVGDNVHMAPVALPALYDTNTPIELPAAFVDDDIHIEDHTGVEIRGLLFAEDDFCFLSGSKTASCDIRGRLLAGELKLQGRNEWNWVTGSEWQSRLLAFVSQLSGNSPQAYFPNWLSSQHDLSSEPLLKIRPRSDAVSYHWTDFSDPIFVPHANDAGLLWQIVRWNDEL